MDFDIKALLTHARTPVIMDAKEGDQPFGFVPDGYKPEDLERFLGAPIRKRAKVTMADTPSFIEYIKKHGAAENTMLYTNADFEKQAISITGVLADHGQGVNDAKWRGDHIATFSPQQTVEWKRWNDANGQAMTQVEFAEFLEENISDIAMVEGMPSGADMLKMAIQFEATSDKAFRSKVNIDNGGVQMTYVDQANEQTVETMKVFKQFSLGLPVFIGADTYRLDARLKWRQNGTALSFYFELIRPDRVFKSSVEDEMKKIGEAGFPILYGTPGL